MEINQTGSQLGWFPVMKMNHGIIHVVKTETWKTQAAPWKSRDAFSFENRTVQSFLENESLSKRKDLNMKSSQNNKGTAVRERSHTTAGRQESAYKPSWARKQCRYANKHWKPFIHKYHLRKTLSTFLAVSEVLGQELKQTNKTSTHTEVVLSLRRTKN